MKKLQAMLLFSFVMVGVVNAEVQGYGQRVSEGFRHYGSEFVKGGKLYGSHAVKGAKHYGPVALQGAKHYGSRAVAGAKYYGSQGLELAKRHKGKIAAAGLMYFGAKFAGKVRLISGEVTKVARQKSLSEGTDYNKYNVVKATTFLFRSSKKPTDKFLEETYPNLSKKEREVAIQAAKNLKKRFS